ncbi:excisionase [Pseudomonas koreensis]|uniref:excisionase n=1 Tax=Pseudomonas koreensis TaxID=198620 RepID=UPI0021C7AD77|nr:excisionase [Pseudomonas koreensis]MCU0089974.1 excisionase [Pseudomonas koreensis]
MRYLTVRKFASESGYTEAAVRSKIADGTWIGDQVWRHAPDGRVLIDVIGFEAWVEMGKQSATNRADKLRSRLSPAPLMDKAKRGSPKPLE